MPYIEHTAELTLFGETVEVPMLIQYELHDGLPAVKEAGGAVVEPAEGAHCEIRAMKIITRYGKAGKLGYSPPKFAPADWLLKFITDDQRGEIENAILEELE